MVSIDTIIPSPSTTRRMSLNRRFACSFYFYIYIERLCTTCKTQVIFLANQKALRQPMSQSYLASLCSWGQARELPRVQGLGSKGGAVVRALASHQVSEVSTTCAVVIFRVKVIRITSVDGIILWLLICHSTWYRHRHAGEQNMRWEKTIKFTILNDVSSFIVLSQCLSWSPSWQFWTTWMTGSKGPILPRLRVVPIYPQG